MTQRARANARPKFCWTRTRSRCRSGAASVTAPNGAGDGGRKASPILLRSHPSSPPARAPRIRDGGAFFGGQDPVPCSGTRTNCARPSKRLGTGQHDGTTAVALLRAGRGKR
ncbi:hypothetical protein B0I37DRAFT_441858, partial [Chaetomium sp. MPI-CAGE-AT-0009]